MSPVNCKLSFVSWSYLLNCIIEKRETLSGLLKQNLKGHLLQKLFSQDIAVNFNYSYFTIHFCWAFSTFICKIIAAQLFVSNNAYSCLLIGYTSPLLQSDLTCRF